MNLILPENMDAPSIPESFLSRLRSTDANLVIYWNRFKNRFIIDRCTNPDIHQHDASCVRTNVLVVESPDGGYMGPNDRVIDQIRGMDAWSKFGTIENYRRDHENKKAEHDQKAKESTRQAYREGMLDDKRQITQALDLIARHDVARPHTK